MAAEKRKMERRKVSYYLPVTEPGTTKPLGVVIDISLTGFELETNEQTPVGQVKHFYINLPEEVAPKAARTFGGRCRWCRQDDFDPSSFTVGYEFVTVSQANAAFFKRLFEEYGVQADKAKSYNRDDYFWK